MLSFFAILGIAVALAMDAFAVSICYGCGLPKFSAKIMFLVAGVFAIFQAAMAFLGWWGGMLFASYIEAVDHFVAFGLLVFIGGKMIYEAFRGADECYVVDPNKINFQRLFLLAFATSIDALALGLSFAILKTEILLPSLIIGLVTLLFSMLGVAAGHGLKKVLGRKVEIAGGIILILIGTQILISHLTA
ncbi:MAG: manganese efflux pump MntP family protein [Candidatus Neomarinimicrobiota bacterium]|jgi:putative Mn2+ efflux pump MntP